MRWLQIQTNEKHGINRIQIRITCANKKISVSYSKSNKEIIRCEVTYSEFHFVDPMPRKWVILSYLRLECKRLFTTRQNKNKITDIVQRTHTHTHTLTQQ